MNADEQKRKNEDVIEALDKITAAWQRWHDSRKQAAPLRLEDGREVLQFDDAPVQINRIRETKRLLDDYFAVCEEFQEIVHPFMLEAVGSTQATYPGVTILGPRRELHYRGYILMLLNYPPSTIGTGQRWAEEPSYLRGHRVYIERNGDAAEFDIPYRDPGGADNRNND